MLGARLPYDDLQAVRMRLAEVAPHFGVLNAVEAPVWLNGQYIKGITDLAASQMASNSSLATPISNFYMTDAISRASQTMAKCVLARQALLA